MRKYPWYNRNLIWRMEYAIFELLATRITNIRATNIWNTLYSRERTTRVHAFIHDRLLAVPKVIMSAG